MKKVDSTDFQINEQLKGPSLAETFLLAPGTLVRSRCMPWVREKTRQKLSSIRYLASTLFGQSYAENMQKRWTSPPQKSFYTSAQPLSRKFEEPRLLLGRVWRLASSLAFCRPAIWSLLCLCTPLGEHLLVLEPCDCSCSPGRMNQTAVGMIHP